MKRKVGNARILHGYKLFALVALAALAVNQLAFLPAFLHIRLRNNASKDIDAPVNLSAGSASAIKLRNASKDIDAPVNLPPYGISIVRCKENSTWINTLPKEWHITIHERCGEAVSQDFSVAVPNTETEDISAHMSYIADNYNNLPPVLIFLQPDAFVGYGKPDRKCAHTPFSTVDELINNVSAHLKGFLALGPNQPSREELIGAPYHGLYMNETWSYIFINDTIKEQKPLTFIPGSHFAVRKERVLQRPQSVYQNIANSIYNSTDQR